MEEIDKAGFADAVDKFLVANDWTLEEFGNLFGVTPTTVANWRNPTKVDMPHKKRWDKMKRETGIDCNDFVREKSVIVSGERSQGVIIADNGATVNASCDYGSGEIPTNLTKFERELWELFRKFGNQAIAERCYKQLKAIEAMSTM